VNGFDGVKPEDVEKEILSTDNNATIDLFLSWSANQKVVPISCIEKLSEVLNGDYQIAIKINSSLALSYFAENSKTKGEILN
jgi:hypothetical protein